MKEILSVLSLLISSLVLSQESDRQLFLHLDKPYYLTNDTLKFAAYQTPVDKNEEVLFIEISNGGSEIVTLHQIALKNGCAQSQFTLPDTLSSGTFLLAAFTNKTRNYPENIFTYFLPIINPEDIKTTESDPTPSLSLFPEGGSIVAGGLNKIVYFASFFEGDHNATLTENGDTLGIISLSNGFGQFQLPAKINHTYKIHYETSEGWDSVSLPAVVSNTVGIKTSWIRNGDLKVYLNIGENMKSEELTIRMIHHNVSVANSKINTNNSTAIIQLKSQSIPDGISNIEVNNSSGVIATQAIFKEPNSVYPIKIKTNKDQYTRGEKVQLTLELLEPVRANLSISIRNNRFFEKNRLPNITNYRISKPIGSIPIFHNTEVSDPNLMLTTNIAYKSVMPIPSNKEIYNQGINRINLWGTVKVRDSKTPLPDTTISLTMFKSEPDILFTKTNNLGQFFFQIPEFKGSASGVLKIAQVNELQNNIDYQLENYALNFSKFNSKLNLSTQMKAYLEYAEKNEIINRVYHPNTYLITSRHETNGSFIFEPDFNIVLKEYIELTDFEELTLELLDGVKLKTVKNEKHIYLNKLDRVTGYYTSLMQNQPLRLVDGVPIYDNQLILNLPISDLSRIYVKHEQVYLNGQIFDGIIDIQTVDNEFGTNNNSQTNHQSIQITGYLEDYVPSLQQTKPGRLPHFNASLYWNPDIELTSTSTLEFYTTDDIGDYTIEIQGIDNQNHFFSIYHTITVSEE